MSVRRMAGSYCSVGLQLVISGQLSEADSRAVDCKLRAGQRLGGCCLNFG